MERLIDEVTKIEYPKELLQIQVLDDSTDDTKTHAEALVERYRALGFPIEYHYRADRKGFKAGALAEGLNTATGEFVAIFDADFIPPVDFLEKTIHYFADPGVGVVQTRWTYLNRDYNFLTEVEALLLDGHFILEHGARSRAGYFFNFNGTAGILRRRTIDEAGGWQSVEMHGFQVQQSRWAKGLTQVAKKVLPQVLRAKLPVRLKVEAFLHLTPNICYPLMLVISALMLPVMIVRFYMGVFQMVFLDLPLIMASFWSISAFYMVAYRELYPKHWKRSVFLLPLLMAIGVALTVINTRAALEALAGIKSAFVRTPKYAIEGRTVDLEHKKYRRKSGWLPFIEIAVGSYFLYMIAFAIETYNYFSIPFLALFTAGYYWAGFLTLYQEHQVKLRWLRERRAFELQTVR